MLPQAFIALLPLFMEEEEEEEEETETRPLAVKLLFFTISLSFVLDYRIMSWDGEDMEIISHHKRDKDNSQ